MQAALDSVFWYLKTKHLTPEAVIAPDGSLHAALPCIRTLLHVAVSRARSSGDETSAGDPSGRSLALLSPRAALISRHLRDSLKAAFRLAERLLTAATADVRLDALLSAGAAGSSLVQVRYECGLGGHGLRSLVVCGRAMRFVSYLCYVRR